MTSLLITQCLQNDFVKPLSSREVLPNLLHIGPDESCRLMGDDLESGPVGQFMQWALELENQHKLNIIHIRDWHDSNCDRQKKHLEQFGPHCIKDTEGAKFVYELDTDKASIINSTTLNDFEGTELDSTLSNYTEQKLRVGLIGVWTEAKILFLAYELSTRYPNFEIAVCSALTASSSRSQHYLALEQLKNIVGITVIDSVGEFAQFLNTKSHSTESSGEHIFGKSISTIDTKTELHYSDTVNLDIEDEQLLRYLFRDCKEIHVKVLDGGFSGNFVAGIKSFDLHGQEQAQHVIKLGPRDLMAKERTSFEQIEPILGNNAPAITSYADLNSRGAIKYRYASMGEGKTTTLQDIIQNAKPENSAELKNLLDIVFNERLGRLYRAAIDDKSNLFEYYCFESKWAESIREKVIDLLEVCPDSEDFELPGNRKCKNLYHFYKHELDKLPVLIDDFPFSFIHGDLNGANIIVDSANNVWIIDFFHTHRGHAIKDFSKLDNDLFYIYTSIESLNDLELAFKFTDHILSQENPLDLGEDTPQEFINTQFELTFELSRHIRKLASEVLREDHRHRKAQWLISQLRYSVHTIGFDEPNKLQRIWALYTSCRCAELLQDCL